MSIAGFGTTRILALFGAVALVAAAPSARAQAPQVRQVVASRADNHLFDLPDPGAAPDSTPVDSAPVDSAPVAMFRSVADSLQFVQAKDVADASGGFRIVVSLEKHHIWAIAGPDTVLSAPAAVARGTTLDFDGRSWTFVMPRGVRRVLDKKPDPTWQPPDWLYFETADQFGLKLQKLDRDHPFQLRDGRQLAIENDEVGVINQKGVWAALPTTEHVVFDSTLFMPPLGTKNRIVQGELGKYALYLGDGFMIHGTPEKSSIGLAATHGCVRLADKDIEWLYDHVGVGVKVYVY